MPSQLARAFGQAAPPSGLSVPRAPRQQRSIARQEVARRPRGRQISQAVQARQQRRVAPASQPDLGAQLSSRVASGAIDQSQAERVAHDRQILERAYGPNWREAVYGKGGARGIKGPFSKAQIRTKRNAALDRLDTARGPQMAKAFNY